MNLMKRKWFTHDLQIASAELPRNKGCVSKSLLIYLSKFTQYSVITIKKKTHMYKEYKKNLAIKTSFEKKIRRRF